MQITLVTQPFAALEADALVSYVFEESDPVQGRVAEIDKAAAGLLRKLAKSGELTGKAFENNLLHKPAGLKAKRLLLISGGTAKKFSAYDLRRVAGTAVRTLKYRGIRSFAFIASRSIFT